VAKKSNTYLDDGIICVYHGGKPISLSNFYLSSSLIFKGIGVIPICKDCMKDLFNYYLEKYENDKMALYKFCERIDFPFYESAYKGAKKTSEASGWMLHQAYFKQINSFRNVNNYGDCFDDGDKISNDIKSNKEISVKEEDFIITREMIKVWGSGYTKEDYEFLEDSYRMWTTECKADLLSERKLFRQICLKELEIRKGRESGKNVDKQVEALQKLMKDANVSPKDINAANDPSNEKVLGMKIKEIESTKPCEVFNDKSLYNDYDGFLDYWKRFVLRPMKNLLIGSREFDKEFNIEEGDN
jgi:hypothetical protein